jgi:hypothetical protein
LEGPALVIKIVDALNEILLREGAKVALFFWREWLISS